MKLQVEAVLLGDLKPLGRQGVPSGIDKQPVATSVEVGLEGLLGDHQGDRKNHGGPEKAIHHYPRDHYDWWLAHYPDLALPLDRPGRFGENISTRGLDESAVCIGDIVRLGTAVVQVSQGRQPCWRLNARFNEKTMARRVQESARTGWYYRVLESGKVAPGDSLDLLERPARNWSLQRVLHVLYRDTLNREALSELAELSVLADSWRNLVHRRLEKAEVEDWTARLETPLQE
ncbi:MOSC domain-containing protein [Fodinicurvata sediminis]|uniref:MOSC domain-containing protein n=1 Tax=Fodinicurvata sediminis TaxID=1121832 RepID=UPI0003B4AF7F|nr:MOSC domain-containing protein [Fodinicurvata sediminis]